MRKSIAIFASGSGTNAENIYHHFLNNEKICVSKLICNNPKAGVLDKFQGTDVDTILVQKEDLKSDRLIDSLANIDLIVLAGFLLLIPKELILAFPNKMINIHPSLLPKYGGKGMYGDNVHRAVLAAREKEHGITIHYVNEEFDEGEIIFQEKFSLTEDETLETVKRKIHQLEMECFPKVIEQILLHI